MFAFFEVLEAAVHDLLHAQELFGEEVFKRIEAGLHIAAEGISFAAKAIKLGLHFAAETVDLAAVEEDADNDGKDGPAMLMAAATMVVW
jgi:hypothetical protein